MVLMALIWAGQSYNLEVITVTHGSDLATFSNFAKSKKAIFDRDRRNPSASGRHSPPVSTHSTTHKKIFFSKYSLTLIFKLDTQNDIFILLIK